MSNFFDNLDSGMDEFDIQKAEEVKEALNTLPATIDEEGMSKEALEDEQRRQNLNYAIHHAKKVAKVAEQSVKEVFVLAKSSDNPKAWDSLDKLLKTQLEASKQIISASEPLDGKPGKEGSSKGSDGGVTNIQNNFVGSSSEILAMISGQVPNPIEEAEFVEIEKETTSE